MLKPGFEKQINLEECRRTEEMEAPSYKIRAKIRLDYQGKARPSRFFFGKKSSEEAATELRQQQAALWRNVPVQGVLVEDLEMGEIYFVFDDDMGAEVAFAPLELEVRADSLCYLVRFAVREEFRRLKIMEPTQISLSMQDMEQVFFEVHDQAKTQIMLKARKYQD